MPSYYSFREVRKQMEKSVPDAKKREFVMGYLEGLAESSASSSSDWKISSEKLGKALKRLGVGTERAASSYRQVSPGEISKIQKHMQDRPRF